ncbi:alpha-crystallin A chain-like [Anoplophora glabripennis]|uniref:alpha-crystallin A chain-like n=1 Tax=Anoplophora glabripennis TaxID=217634 RepID=UPI000874D05F|nr:alpha-crystallin A chain-like [Anoplophora glabripennis]
MSLYTWPYDAYTCNPYFDPPPGFYKDPLEDCVDGYWPINTLNTSVKDLRGFGGEDEGQFQVHIDVQQFKPEEISVKIVDHNKSVIIEGKHEEKLDEHGSISRHFLRKFILPENCDGSRLQSQLSSDGVLTLIAPKIEEGKQVEYVREIPITKTGSFKAGEQKRRMSKLKNKCHIL